MILRHYVPLTVQQVTHDDYRPLVNQIYPNDDPWLETDTVFAVKDDLVVNFAPAKDSKAELDLEYNIVLVPKNYEEGSISKL